MKDNIIRDAIEASPGIQVKYIATNKRIFTIYIILNKGFNGDVYDYYFWLRKQRKRIIGSRLKVKRKKTPQSEHDFRKMSIKEFYTKYIK